MADWRDEEESTGPTTAGGALGVIGWDIGGVNTKVAYVTDGEVRAVRGRPYELQRDPHALAPLLCDLAVDLGAVAGTVAHAVTMTAELSQMFRTKREGVAFVLDAVESAFSSALVRVFSVEGGFLSIAEARDQPLLVAAANWSATARVVAQYHRDAVLIDIGTTTTDIIPIVDGCVAAEGRTDPERLVSGELVYTGALRTPVEAIATHVPLAGTTAGVSAEGFALAGDVHVWRGALEPVEYTVPTPDGRPATREFAGERLARVVCADRELLDARAISEIADALTGAQVARIAVAIERVLARHRSLRLAVVTGLGAFLGEAAASAAGLRVVPLAGELGEAAARCAPATSVALLLDRAMNRVPAPDAAATARGSDAAVAGLITLPPASDVRRPARGSMDRATEGALVETVVKLGGGVLPHVEHFEAVLTAIAAAARARTLLIVPGGGPFADAVREADRRIGLSHDAAHWMAILAMDQYAHLIASRLPKAMLVRERREIAAALTCGRIPVLAPSLWLRAADPLPHSWDVTSDSIAAWVAGQIGARRLVLVKPVGATAGSLMDPHFPQALPADVIPVVVTADQKNLRATLRG